MGRQPRSRARSPSSRPAAPAPTAASSRPVTSQGEGSAAIQYGGWGPRPGSGGAGVGEPAGGERARHVQVLPPPVHLGPPVGSGHAVVELDLHLAHPEPLAQQVDGQAGLDAEPGGERPGGLERLAGQATLPGQRLGGDESGRLADAIPGEPHHEPVPAAGLLLRRQDRDGHVGLAAAHRVDERCRVGGRVHQVGVEEEQETRSLPALPALDRGHGGRAGLQPSGLAARARVTQHDGPGAGRDVVGGVPRPVVHHDDEVDTGDLLRRLYGRSDAEGLVAGGDDDGDVPAEGFVRDLLCHAAIVSARPPCPGHIRRCGAGNPSPPAPVRPGSPGHGAGFGVDVRW